MNMKRKVIKQGPSSFMVCLPKDWVRQKEVKKGQELNVEIIGETIQISIEEFDSNKDVLELKFDEMDLEQIYNVYSEGFPGINIQFESEREFKKIKKIVDSLIGGDFLLRFIFYRKRMGIDFVDYKISLEHLKNIQKGIISFYERADINPFKAQDYNSLESLEDLFVNLTELFSKERGFSNNLDSIFRELVSLKSSIESAKLDKYLFALFD